MRALALGLLVGSVVLAACSDDEPANVEGNFTVSVANRDNGCNFPNYTVGDTQAGIPVTITQEGTNVTATIMGLTGAGLSLGLGSNIFSGTVDGDQMVLDLFGTRPQMQATCTYTFNAKILGSVDGDAIEGRVEYRAATTTPSNPDCASIQGCLTFQEFNGTRPPT
ncbi:MAG: hypothetical protein AB7T06_21450 [Kofleriaceae bacterium]